MILLIAFLSVLYLIRRVGKIPENIVQAVEHGIFPMESFLRTVKSNLDGCTDAQRVLDDTLKMWATERDKLEGLMAKTEGNNPIFGSFIWPYLG